MSERKMRVRNAIAVTALLWCGIQLRAEKMPEEQLAKWRSEIVQTLDVAHPSPELKVERFGSFSPEPGVVAEKVSYGTEFSMRIPAVVYRPEHHARRMPAMVVVKGHGGDKYSSYSLYTGFAYERAGGAVGSYERSGEGQANEEHKSGG